MGWFGWGSAKGTAPQKAILSGPQKILANLDKRVPQYIADADQEKLVYPACKRAVANADDVRAVWDYTRLEAVRYVMMVPGRGFELLIDPVSQSDLLNAFLRQPPHENTVIDFTGAAMNDIAIAVFAGFNWLNHCAVLAGADRENFSGMLHHFRKLVIVAQQWWAMEGAVERCGQMLAAGEKPPLMLFLIWSDYNRLAKEIAAAVLNRAISAAATEEREALAQAMARLQRAHEPDGLSI